MKDHIILQTYNLIEKKCIDIINPWNRMNERKKKAGESSERRYI